MNNDKQPDVGQTGDGLSYKEKLEMAASGLIDPQEIGIASQEDAVAKVLGEAPMQPKLGDFVTFECSVVPLELRAHWARQDLKIIPSNPTEWEADWIKSNKNSYALQGEMRSGTTACRVGQLFTDPVLGFADLMRKAADMLEKRYEELKATDEDPIITRAELLERTQANLQRGPKKNLTP